jgi:RNA polymerase sigma-70 factor (ECF subfamily)
MEDSLISNLRRKDKRTQEYFYKTFAKPMFLLCYRYLNNEQEASEILNDGFHKVFTQIDKFQNGGVSGLKAWTKKIMINECLQHLRQRKNIHFVESIDIPSDDATYKPDQELNATTYYNLISRLPTGYRTVFNLYVIEGYSHNEIADILNITENTSKSHLLRARNLLKEKIQNQENYAINK